MLQPSQTKSSSLTGQFTKEKALLRGVNGFDLLIRNREAKNTTSSKTTQFILLIDHRTKKRKYVSSLWQTHHAGIYEFEYSSVRYCVDLNRTNPEIYPLNDTRR